MDEAAELDRLYGLPLDEFVKERDALAKRLRGEDREAAAAVKALRKPTVGAWALNQAIRRRRSETDELLETADALRDAYRDMLRGGDPARTARDDAREERSLTSVRIADCAEVIASENREERAGAARPGARNPPRRGRWTRRPATSRWPPAASCASAPRVVSVAFGAADAPGSLARKAPDSQGQQEGAHISSQAAHQDKAPTAPPPSI